MQSRLVGSQVRASLCMPWCFGASPVRTRTQCYEDTLD